MKPTVIILCGIPTSGKSTWAEMYQKIMYVKYTDEDFRHYRIISRDWIRFMTFGPDYKQNPKDEKRVTELFNNMLEVTKTCKYNSILDNTHCKESFLNEALKNFPRDEYDVKIKFFDLPLWKAYYRNVKRYLQTGKWIPFKVIKTMKKNYDQINKRKYELYAF